MNKQTFSNINRSETVRKMKTDAYDLLVIGGGITGAGIALDAVTRGMKVALVEMQDFAAGTSSRSTKLVHGGLRYLKQFEVKMVAEVGKERAIVYENGPHVTTPEWMLLPIHKGGTFGKFSTSVGLRVYDFLAGVKKSEKRKMLSREAALQKEPLVKKDGLQGGGYYVEYRTDDARLTIEVMKEAVQRGAHVLNYAKANQFIYQNKQIIGVHIGDLLSGEAFPVKAKKVVNAAGPWVDQVRGNDYAKNNKELRLTKGVHLVISQEKFPLKQAIYFDTPDKRMVFAIPRDGKTYVGTTDTFFDGDKANPKMTKEDRDYILKAIHFMFPEVKVAKEDVESSWAGVRPLIYEEGKDPSEISRKDEVWEAESGLITIAGGKLTGYRKMAETVVNLVAERITESGSPRYKGCQTKHLPISGGDFGGSAQMERYVESFESKAAAVGLPAEVGREIAQKYGTNAEIILKYVKTNKTNLPSKIYAELQYAIDHEMVYKPVDFFIRRTGALFFDRSWVNEWKKPVIDHMGKSLGWKKEEFAQYTAELEKELKDAVEPVDIQ